MHAQIGHNEPNQPTSVHTIDNKPYIFDSRRSFLGGREDDLYLRIAETRAEICCCCGRRRKLRQLLRTEQEYSAKRLTNRGVTCDLDDFLKRAAQFDTHITTRSVFYGMPHERRERIPGRIVTESASTYKYSSNLLSVFYTSLLLSMTLTSRSCIWNI